MKKHISGVFSLGLLSLLLLLPLCGVAQHTAAPFILDMKMMAGSKAKISKGDKSVMQAYNKLIKEADKALKSGPFAVTNKKTAEPANDLHDYVSIAPYWFPNPNTPDGLPYIRKDGQRNPEVDNYPDKEALPKMVSCVDKLALAYYFTGKEIYAAQAVKLIRVFFLEESTRMNPNMNYAQAIKGQNDGRGAGLIESRHFVKVIDAIGLLQTSKNWTSADQSGMEQWFADFLHWMQTSKNGRDEMRAKNNHGAFYDMQRMSYAMFTKNTEVVNAIVERFKDRIDYQQDTDGSFPAELTRTIGLHYSTFVLKPFFGMASMAERLNIDLWNYVSENGKSLRTAIEFLYPYATGLSTWKWQQIKPYEHSGECVDLLKMASLKYQDPKYVDGLSRVISAETAANHMSNLVLGLDMK